MKLSIVATLYQSAPYLEDFHRRASAAARDVAGNDYEIVLVNDGSPDDCLQLAIALSRADDHVVVVDLSRNFGHHKAIMAGLAQASGDRIFLIDSDLEEEPEWVAAFWAQMEQDGSDVVYGIQARRTGGLFERWSGALFYRIFRALTGLDLPSNIALVRLMTRRYVAALLLHEEREVFLAGLLVITGFKQTSRTVTKRRRIGTTYSLRRRISQFVDSITSFSNKPLVAIFVLGCVVSFLALLFTLYLIANWLMFARPPEGWTSVIASVWLLGGIVIAANGVIGIYLSKMFLETKRRPSTIVRQIYGANEAGRSQ